MSCGAVLKQLMAGLSKSLGCQVTLLTVLHTSSSVAVAAGCAAAAAAGAGDVPVSVDVIVSSLNQIETV
jgi:hypothetical protein